MTPPPLADGEEAGPPDFVGIGVQKAGTTWWYELILDHPDVASPQHIHKERHFFDRYATGSFGPADVERYHGWFPRRQGMVTGEWTPDYLSYPWAPGLLQAAAPDVRLLVLLRDPVERYLSGLAHLRRMGEDVGPTSLADAAQRGFYDRLLAPWVDRFGPQRLLVLQYERCVADPVDQLRSTFEFLGLRDVRPTVRATGTSGERSGPARSPDLGTEVAGRLTAMYEKDVEALAARLPGLDLALWPNFSYLTGVSPTDGSSSPVRRP
jgi:hypothetical protein